MSAGTWEEQRRKLEAVLRAALVRAEAVGIDEMMMDGVEWHEPTGSLSVLLPMGTPHWKLLEVREAAERLLTEHGVEGCAWTWDEDGDEEEPGMDQQLLVSASRLVEADRLEAQERCSSSTIAIINASEELRSWSTRSDARGGARARGGLPAGPGGRGGEMKMLVLGAALAALVGCVGIDDDDDPDLPDAARQQKVEPAPERECWLIYCTVCMPCEYKHDADGEWCELSVDGAVRYGRCWTLEECETYVERVTPSCP